MAHLTSFPGSHEIVEIEEELNPDEHYRNNNDMKAELKREEKDRRSIASNTGQINSLEDDLNQLFEMFNRRASSHGLTHSNQAGTSRKNSSKKPIKSGGSYSPGPGISDRVNLKQALRGLCLSQASEMAAMKRSAKSRNSSEAGRIMTLYRNVVVEDSVSENSEDDGRGSMLEISLVPEESTFGSFRNSPESLPASDLWPSNRSSLAERGAGSVSTKSVRVLESKESGNQTLRREKSLSVSLTYPHVDDDMPEMAYTALNQNRRIMMSTEAGYQMSATNLSQKEKQMLLPSSSSPTAKHSIREVTKSSMTENGKLPVSAEFAGQTSLTESLQKEKRASPSSSGPSYSQTTLESARKMPSQKETIPASVGAGNQTAKAGILHKEEYARSPRYSDLVDKGWERRISGMMENGNFPPSSTEPLRKEKHASLRPSSPHSQRKTYVEPFKRMPEQKEVIPTSIGTQVDLQDKEEHPPARSLHGSDPSYKSLEGNHNLSATSKLVGEEPPVKSTKVGAKVQKDSSKVVPSSGSPKGKKASKSTKNAHHLVKPLIKTKNFVKRKSKKKIASDNSSKNARSEFHNDLYSRRHPIVCPRCQCVVTDAWKESNQESPKSHQDSPVSHQESLLSHQESPLSHHESPVSYQDSPVSPFVSLSADVSSGHVISDVSTPGPSSDSLNKSKTVVEAKSYSKSRDKGELMQSSKLSPGECSSSTSYSEESNLSRPSFCDRPHMSKDVRWEAIRCVRYQHGTIGLRHFNLLKKLGCGDIGTVYLAELIGTNCLFAIKVMDNEFLARRKKIGRAQTEKEILRMLDHPFLPTLYCRFTSDNLSCLVMEYCPGGDLHVLRQRQPGRCFTEQAARFYVAEVLLALEYLHMLGVIYRDLKPENILVREDGHIMLSDFDLSLRCAVSPTLLVSASTSEPSRKNSGPCSDARCVEPLCIEPSCQVTCFTPRLLATSSSKSKKLRKLKSDLAAEMRPLLQLVAEPTSARSNSFVGTHEYLAPEIIKGEGHGSAVDWWTFGIFLYELLYGRTPFKGAGNEETLANVVLQSLKFPDSPLVSLQARDLISALLVKEPENRLGTERGAAEIKQHPFFNGLNWALIRCAVPPELPDYRSYGIPKAPFQEKNKCGDCSSGAGSGDHLEFEVF